MIIQFLPYSQRVGYACINMTLANSGVTTNRHAIQRTFKLKGIGHISKLCLANVTDLYRVITWNNENNIKFYRISSALFPWMSEYEFEELPDWKAIQGILRCIGEDALKHRQRLEFHPGHFTILASPTDKTVKSAIRDLEQHSRIFDEMQFKPSHWNSINIHLGGSYGGDKEGSAKRWVDQFNNLSINCKQRIVIENDDKANMYSVLDLHTLIYDACGVPITFDIFHHNFCTGGLSRREAARLAASTWGNIPMVIHWSSSMKLYENPSSKSVAHADYIYDSLEDWDTGGWFMFESKAKELSVLEYLKKGPRPQIIC